MDHLVYDFHSHRLATQAELSKVEFFDRAKVELAMKPRADELKAKLAEVRARFAGLERRRGKACEKVECQEFLMATLRTSKIRAEVGYAEKRETLKALLIKEMNLKE